MTVLEFGSIRVELSNRDKVLYPATGTTKGEVIDYYVAVAAAMLPHIAGRPVTRKRWPNGVEHPAFFEKNLAAHAPAWLGRRSIEHSSRLITYPVIYSVAGLAWLGQQASLEVHVPQWRFDGDRRGPATRLVFDLDPGEDVTLAECAEVAVQVRDMIASIGMRSYPVTSGSKGIHIYVPLDRELSPGGASTVAKQVAENLQSLYPDRVTATMAKAARGGKVFLDWSQNNPAKTTIAPYSLRGRAHPTVAAPRSWSELEDPTDLRQLTFQDVLARIAADGDLLAGLDRGVGTVGDKPAPAPVVAVPEPDPMEDLDVASPPCADDDAAGPATVMPGAEFPRDMAPMLASPGEIGGFDSEDWAFEVKWDGYRLIAEIDRGELTLRHRSGEVVTERYPNLAGLGRELAGHQVVLDGEVVVYDDAGASNFGLLQLNLRHGQFIAFDVLFLDGVSLLRKRYSDRRQLLAALAAIAPTMVVAPQLDGPGSEALAYSKEHGLEGVIAKRHDSVYLPGKRGRSWVKHKNWRTQSVVVGGWRHGRGERDGGVGSLLVGLDIDGELHYAGKVGTGFTAAMLATIAEQLQPLRRDSSPFIEPLEPAEQRDVTWVEPIIRAEVRYLEWTETGRLRHPAFVRFID